MKSIKQISRAEGDREILPIVQYQIRLLDLLTFVSFSDRGMAYDTEETKTNAFDDIVSQAR